ncbi:extracellular solute-binding protein [Streptomyces sp. NBC_00006]|uniref:ABC transporter substrate-binding protein n=1 Tax=Streptomyces sp. NBC_00006 TaxID=2975619 RepID=UPI00225A5672|nr:extracellular solute-binding protein [Streptomyces sp. NBC_00006]MCX5537067.1 extracellular solute-binding protein [Streptomyces sp. NBC_00006]
MRNRRTATSARTGTLARTGLAAALLLTVGACGGGGFSGGGDDGKGGEGDGDRTVRVLVNITPNLTKKFWNDLVAPFEKAHPGVDVKIEAPTGKGVADTLQQQLAAGDAPDVVETLLPDKTLAPQMLDLTDEAWTKNTPLVKEASLDGRVHAVGVGEQAQSLVFYNKDAFTKAGIRELPENLDEFTAAMGKLKKAGYLPLQTSGDFATGLQLLQFTDPALAGRHPDWYGKVNSGDLTVGSSMRPYLKLYKSWIDRGYIDKNALGVKYADGETNFLTGKSAMYVMGSWFTATEAAAKKDFEVGVFAAPVEKGQSYPGPQGATLAAPYMILKNTGSKELARDLVEFLVTDKKAVTAQLKQDGNFRSGAERALSPLEQDVQNILDDAPDKVAQGEGYGDDTLPKGFNTAWNTEVQGLYAGRSPEDVAKAVDRWVKDHS